jgi:hypothetical protein
MAPRALAPTLNGKDVDREVIAALRGLCHVARAWAIHPESMLRTNGLMNASDVDELEHWVDTSSPSRR